MKKFVSLLLSLIFVMSCFTVAFAAEDISADVYVSVSDRGNLVVAYKKIAVTDVDKNGKINVNDVIICVHDKYYDGGAAKGYETAATSYGLSITKLWGQTNNGSFSYYLNDNMCGSLDDVVKTNDHVYCYSYKDAATFTDLYAFFDVKSGNAKQNDVVTLTLSAYSFDESWNLVKSSVEGAEITVNGKATGVKTDKDGKATVTLSSSGEQIISAVSPSDKIITPPVASYTVSSSLFGGNGNILERILSFVMSLINTIFEFVKNISKK